MIKHGLKAERWFETTLRVGLIGLDTKVQNPRLFEVHKGTHFVFVMLVERIILPELYLLVQLFSF